MASDSLFVVKLLALLMQFIALYKQMMNTVQENYILEAVSNDVPNFGALAALLFDINRSKLIGEYEHVINNMHATDDVRKMKPCELVEKLHEYR